MGRNERFFYWIMVILLLVSTMIGGLAIFAVTNRANITTNFLLSFIGALFLALSFFIMLAFIACVIVYRNQKSSRIWALIAGLGLKIMYPVMLLFSGFFKEGKDIVRGFFIEINNKLVSSRNLYVSPDKVLILLPHCLQNNNCSYKVAGNISNCRHCGACKLGELALLADEFAVNLYVATGGTAARKIIKEKRPEAIISVACERDLASGIIDVKGIPVIGILNDRPNGPCFNTDVQLDRVREELNKLCQKRM